MVALEPGGLVCGDGEGVRVGLGEHVVAVDLLEYLPSNLFRNSLLLSALPEPLPVHGEEVLAVGPGEGPPDLVGLGGRHPRHVHDELGHLLLPDDDAAAPLKSSPLQRVVVLPGGPMPVPLHELASVVDGIVYVGSLNGHLFALDALTGDLLWDRKVSDESYSVSAGGGKVYDSVFSPPSVVGGIVYLGSDYGIVSALHALTGDLLWQYETSDDVVYAPIVIDGSVYVSSFDGLVHALDAFSGELLWRYKAGSGILFLTLIDGLVYIRTGRLEDPFILSASTGEPLQPRDEDDDLLPSSPTLVERTVYVADLDIGPDHTLLYAQDPIEGRVLWRYEIEGRVEQQATAANGILYVISRVNSTDRYLYALSGPFEE